MEEKIRIVEQAVRSITVTGGASSALADCKVVEIPVFARTLFVEAVVTFDGAATHDVTIECYTSIDGTNYDTVKYTSWDIPVSAGNTVRKSVCITADMMLCKFIANNAADGNDATAVQINTVVKN